MRIALGADSQNLHTVGLGVDGRSLSRLEAGDRLRQQPRYHEQYVCLLTSVA